MYLSINQLLVRPRAQIFVFIVLTIALIGISCGGSDDTVVESDLDDDTVVESDLDAVQITSPAQGGDGDPEAVGVFGYAVQITLPDSVFTVDDVAAVGWKKSKELSPETLPGATSVWYGFYQQRDVEVRVYESQDKAISLGQDLADTSTGRRKPSSMIDSGAITNAQTNTRTSYLTYAIVGNLILLCEIKIEDCQPLLDGIGQ